MVPPLGLEAISVSLIGPLNVPLKIVPLARLELEPLLVIVKLLPVALNIATEPIPVPVVDIKAPVEKLTVPRSAPPIATPPQGLTATSTELLRLKPDILPVSVPV